MNYNEYIISIVRNKGPVPGMMQADDHMKKAADWIRRCLAMCIV